MYQSLNNNYVEPTTVDVESGTVDVESGTQCIICFEIDDKDIIDIKDIKKGIKKCSCSGFVHASCINKWYKNKKNIRCIMCNTSIIRIVPRTPVREPSRPPFHFVSCKLMFIVVIITTIIVIVVFYPDAFDTSTRPDNDSDNANDPSYLQSIMVGQY